MVRWFLFNQSQPPEKKYLRNSNLKAENVGILCSILLCSCDYLNTVAVTDVRLSMLVHVRCRS